MEPDCTNAPILLKPTANVNQTRREQLSLDFSRNSKLYSSLPAYRRHVANVRREHNSRPIVLDMTTANAGCTIADDTGKYLYSCNLPQVQHTANDGYSAASTFNNEHVYGLSNNLSTESIKNACEFYDDELSDDDLIEVQNTPGCFQKDHSLRRSLKAKCLNMDSLKKRKGSEENPLCNEPPASHVATADYYQDDAINVLQELDDILDATPTVMSTQSNASSLLGLEMEGKVEDCLLDLDNYLEEMDACSGTANYDEMVQSAQSSPRKQMYRHRRNRTLPSKRKSNGGNVPGESGAHELIDVNNLRRAQSCATDVNSEDLLAFTSPLPKDTSSTNLWRHCSMRKAASLLLPIDAMSSSRSGADHTFSSDDNEMRNLELNSAIRGTNKQSQLNEALASAATTSYTPPLRTNDDVGQPESHSFNIQQSPNSSGSGMLTQDDIINNLLVQNLSNSLTEDRPRQFGRRSEGHPRVLSLRSDNCGGYNNLTMVNYDQRPTSAPAATVGRREECALQQERHTMYTGSEASSVRSSGNQSPISLVSSSDSSCTVASTNGNLEANLVASDTLQTHMIATDPEARRLSVNSFNSEWPHSFSRTLALLCCTVGLFNICRFAVLTMHYGGNFLLQFMLLSIIFGIPLFWLQMCLGAKIKSGVVSMWKISPICRGIGISLILVQFAVAIYSTVAIAWLIVYLRDSFPSTTYPTYRWQEPIYAYHTNNSGNLTECVADYFNVVVLQRLQLAKRTNIATGVRFLVSDRLAFNLAILWAAAFLILCKGLKSYGKVVFVLALLPLVTLGVVTCKLLYVVDPTKLHNIFTASDFDDFLINSKTWIAAAQEAFLTWGLLGASVIATTSRGHAKGNSKSTLRRDSILVVLITFLCLSIAALLGLICLQILHQHGYVYVPGSFEQAETSTAIYSLKSSTNAEFLSFPTKWLPHYSGFIGETYKRSTSTIATGRESGFQALRFISEVLPAVLALSRDSVSWVWAAVIFTMFIIFGLAQLCIMWKPISNALGNSTSSVLLSCVTGLLLSIPFATEMGILLLHYMDILLGGSWFIPILWCALIFGVFLIRGRPYNGDDLVNDLKMSGSMSAFLALSWNVLLPIGLITLAVIEYKTSYSNQFYYWRGKSYFIYWARKVAALTQIGFLLLVPITSIIQIYRYLTTGPPDILDRMQRLYRPTEGDVNSRTRRNRDNANGRLNAPNGDAANGNGDINLRHALDDAPPKYTPPPSYTTATGARLAKFLRQSLRRSVRRILGEPGRSRPILPIDAESDQQSLPPDYTTVLTHPSGNVDDVTGHNTNDAVDSGPLPANNAHEHRSLSLGRKVFSQKQRLTDTNPRSLSVSRTLERTTNANRPFTAEDVVTVLRSSTRISSDRENTSSRELHVIHPQNSNNTFRSIENLILNAEPLDQSPAIRPISNRSADDAATNDEQNNTSVI